MGSPFPVGIPQIIGLNCKKLVCLFFPFFYALMSGLSWFVTRWNVVGHFKTWGCLFCRRSPLSHFIRIFLPDL